MKKIFTLNVGSSSCKFQIFTQDLEFVGGGLVDKIGIDGTIMKYKNAAGEEVKLEENLQFDQLSDKLIGFLQENNIINFDEVYLMSHRVVNAGEVYPENFLIKGEEDIAGLEALNHMAPLHNPYNNAMLRSLYTKYPQASHVVCFDTAFHSTIKEENFLYGIPYEFYEEHKIRKYGAHGSSHAYITETMEKHLGKPVNIINVHLGNGSSICVTENSKSVNTSMGFTPLAGLIMGTRSGDIDPSIPLYMENTLGMSAQEVETVLTKKSGLLGISGISSDMRELIAAEEQGNRRAGLSREMAAKRVADTISMYLSEVDHVDAITLTGGIGENDHDYIRMVFDRLRVLKINLKPAFSKDEDINMISEEGSDVNVYIVPTNEELFMAKVGKRLIGEEA